MTAWTEDDLTRIGGTEELELASVRVDGTMRPYARIWVVRAGDDLFVRSAYGPDNPWFVRARAAGVGRIRAGGIERDARFADVPATDAVHDDVDAAYHAKYDSHGPAIVGTVVGAGVRAVTLRLLPRES